jgi:hypothetical protein
MLAKAYKFIFLLNKGYRQDVGGQELYTLSVEAYEKCLSLKPDDAQWHAGFADLLAYRSLWDSWSRDTRPEALHALNEIHTALELAPNDPVVREIAGTMTGLLYGGITRNGDSFDFPWLTQTPTTLPPTLEIVLGDATPTLPATPAPTRTSAPPLEPTPTNPAPDPQKPSPLCGSAAFLPLIAMAWFAWKRR